MKYAGWMVAGWLVTGALGCGGSTTGSGGGNSATGSVGGVSLNVASSVAEIAAAESSSSCTGGGPVESDGGASGAPALDGGETCTSTSQGYAVGVGLANVASFSCSTIGSNVEYANIAGLTLVAVDATTPVGPGTYSITNPGGNGAATYAYAIFSTTTATCGAGLNAQATSGSVTLTTVSASHVAGTYSVTFGTQGSLAGSFDTDVCAQPDASASVDDGGAPQCLQ